MVFETGWRDSWGARGTVAPAERCVEPEHGGLLLTWLVREGFPSAHFLGGLNDLSLFRLSDASARGEAAELILRGTKSCSPLEPGSAQCRYNCLLNMPVMGGGILASEWCFTLHVQRRYGEV